MNNLKSTVGFVGSEGVMLKDQSIFEKGEVVIVLSTDNFDEIFRELKAFKDDLEKSKDWINEIKEIKENNI